MFHSVSRQSGVLALCAMLAAACGGVSSNGLARADGSGVAGSGGSGSSAAGAGGAGSGAPDGAADLARITGSAGTNGAGGEASGAGGSMTSGAAGSGTGGAASAGAPGTDANASDALGGDATDAGAAKDACSPTPAVGSDLKRDPAFNACGSTTCEYKTSYCCAPRSSAAPGCQPSPYGSDKSACLAKGALPITCDEKAKCQHSTVCCGVRAAPDADLQVITCVEKVDCQAPDLVICGSNADCYLGQICVPRMIYGERMGVCEAAVATCG
jgi:hypothetical protein